VASKQTTILILTFRTKSTNFFSVQTLMKTRVPGKTEILNELPQVTESIGELADLLNVVLTYVEDVLADRVPPDNTIGRHLLKLTQAVPKMSDSQLDEFLNANIKVIFQQIKGLLLSIH
jgi:hypothetical protein